MNNFWVVTIEKKLRNTLIDKWWEELLVKINQKLAKLRDSEIIQGMSDLLGVGKYN